MFFNILVQLKTPFFKDVTKWSFLRISLLWGLLGCQVPQARSTLRYWIRGAEDLLECAGETADDGGPERTSAPWDHPFPDIPL